MENVSMFGLQLCLDAQRM